MTSRTIGLASVVTMAILAGGCSAPVPEGPDARGGSIAGAKPKVFVVNYPLKYFVERIAGDRVEAAFPAPEDEDPAYWVPAPEVVEAYQKADLILLNGATYAKWIDTATLPKAKMVDTSAGFRNQHIELEGAMVHSHGPEGEHAHRGFAFTTWLDPDLAVQQAAAARDALVKLEPRQEDAYRRNFEALKTDLEALDRRAGEIVARAPNRPVVFSHPVYQYLTRRYELNARSIHWEPDEPPTEAMWTELEQLLAEHPAKWMIWEGAPMEQTVAKLAEMGIRSTVFHPCGNVPAEGDYLSVQRRNLTSLDRVFAASP
ncbi:MAG: metal ABC transporter substrate-binding protein [Planctomycetota bacterium]